MYEDFLSKVSILGKHITIDVDWTQQTQTYLYNICTMSDQRRRRWVDVVQMLYKCFVFAVTVTK